jgi:hypothetical protein
MMVNKNSVLTILCGLLPALNLWTATSVFFAPGHLNTLDKKYAWALEQMKETNAESPVWVGYNITRLEKAGTRISWNSDDRYSRETLAEILNRSPRPSYETSMTLLEAAKAAGQKHTDGQEPLVEKELAFLFLTNSVRKHGEPFKEIKMTQFDCPVHLENRSVIWLGTVPQTESLQFLSGLYAKTDSESCKKDLIVGIASHTLSDPVIEFLKNRIEGGEPDELRESAVFWVGQQPDPHALNILKDCVNSDRSPDIREKAIFSISQMDIPEAEEVLIDLAYHAPSGELSKKAVFWLGQKASEKAVKALKEVVFSANETELQKHAVFALSQWEDGNAVTDLIHIAETHPNPEVRKHAIFWLGETGDPRAVDALVRMVRSTRLKNQD